MAKREGCAIRGPRAGLALKDLVQQYRQAPDVLFAEPNYRLHALTTPNDTLYGQLWGMTKISAPAAWDLITGSSIVVAVIDTGVKSFPGLPPVRHAAAGQSPWAIPCRTFGAPNRNRAGPR